MNGEHDKTAGAAEAGNLLHDLIGLAKAGQQPPLGIPALFALTFREQVVLKAFDKLYPDGFMTVEGYVVFAKRVRDLTDAVCAAMEAEPETPRAAPVKVPMRLHTCLESNHIWTWMAFFAGRWIIPGLLTAAPGSVLELYQFVSASTAKIAGNAWLRDLSTRLGIPLEADWEVDTKEDKT